MPLENRLDTVNTANRRGLLLGLTLSEIMMIILFALLLLFGAVFAEQDEDRRRLAELEKLLAKGEIALALVDPMRNLLDQVGINQTQIDDVLREMKLVERLRQEIKNLKDQQTALAPVDEPDAKKKLKELTEELRKKEAELAAVQKKLDQLQREMAQQADKRKEAAKLANAMVDAGITPEQAKDADKTVGALKAVMEDLRQRMVKAGVDAAKVDAIVQTAGKDWANTAMDNKNLAEQTKYWKAKWEADVGNGKKGVTPCWATNGVVDFIYDVALTDDGMNIRRNQVPQWAEDYDRLPVEGIRLGPVISQAEFTTSTRPLFDYSNRKDKDCRFFVRLYDETSVNAKLIYQQRRRAVEGHFFILDMKDAKFYAVQGN